MELLNQENQLMSAKTEKTTGTEVCVCVCVCGISRTTGPSWLCLPGVFVTLLLMPWGRGLMGGLKLRREGEEMRTCLADLPDHLECLDGLDSFISVPSNKLWTVRLISAWTQEGLLTIKITIPRQSETRIHQHHPSLIKWICLCSPELP